MSIPGKIISFLEKTGAKYEPLTHKTVYTAYDKAATLKVKPNIIAKTLVLKTGKEMAIAVIPGDKNLDKNKLKKVINDYRKKKGEKTVKSVEFISEKTMRDKFKGVKIGALPPFGQLWQLPTFVDLNLLKNAKIIVNAANYNQSFKISPAELKKLIPDLATGNFSKKKPRQ